MAVVGRVCMVGSVIPNHTPPDERIPTSDETGPPFGRPGLNVTTSVA